MTLRKLVPLIKQHYKYEGDKLKAIFGGGEEEKTDDESFSTILGWRD